jgi:hypothetical protein
MTYRHALRVSEAIDLKWDKADLAQGKLHVNRLKKTESRQFITSRAMKFGLSVSCGAPTVGGEASLKLSVHPHLLRHGKGYQLASEGVDTRAIQAYMATKTFSIRLYRPSSIQSGLGLGKGCAVVSEHFQKDTGPAHTGPGQGQYMYSVLDVIGRIFKFCSNGEAR